MSVGRVVALATERLLQPVEGMHRTIADSWFSALGAIGRPVRVAHHAVSGIVYGSIRAGATGLGIVLDARAANDPSAADRTRAFINGLWGDALGQHGPTLGTAMDLRDSGGNQIPLGAHLAEAIPDATDRLVVMVHGLMETERCWYGSDDGAGLMSALEGDPALTPVTVRYNTGLAVGDNGAELASLLEALHAGWPRPVRSIALVGHSMGGLVITSACAAAQDAGHHWIADVNDVVAIGTPHRGAPLAKLAHAAARGLGVASQTRPLADFLDTRSRGIKDLRVGPVAVAPDGESSRPPDIDHHFIAGVITSNVAHPLAWAVGDLIVRPASSTGAPSIEPEDVVVFGGLNHFDMLGDPAVIDQVMVWLTPPRDHERFPVVRQPSTTGL